MAMPVDPLSLAPTHRGSTPMDTPRRDIIPMGTPIRDHQECQGAHCAPLTAIRSTTRSTRSTPSTTEASTPAAQAAVLTLTEEDISHPHGGEVTKHEAECPMGTTCMLFCSFPLLEQHFA